MRLIDADAMMKRLKAWDTNDAIDKALYNFALSRVLEAPTVVPERKKGRWIKVSGKTAINCSACYRCSWSLSFEDTVKRFNFCPNCGADMRGENNG